MKETASARWSEQATADDVYYCYRLLLGREPDEEGLKFWIQRLETEPFTCAKLAAYFCRSTEYLTSIKARGIKLITLDGFDLYVPEYDWDIAENLIRTGRHEPHVTAYLKKHLRAGMTFIDVGANIGYFTMMAARLVGRGGRTIAIECNPKNCELIYLSLRRNGFNDVLVYPFALGDRQQLRSFSLGFSNAVVIDLPADKDEEAIIVPAVTLDSLVQHEPRIDVIKMDIEGSEARAWQGMQQVIERHHPLLLMEFFPALLRQYSGARADEFLASIFARDYTAVIVGPGENDVADASSPEAVMAAWNKQSEAMGDESKASLDVAFHPV